MSSLYPELIHFLIILNSVRWNKSNFKSKSVLAFRRDFTAQSKALSY